MPINAQGDAHSNATSPDYWHPHFREIEPTLEYVKDMFLGRRRWIDDGGKILDSEKAYYYLPQAEAQEDDQYIRQLRASVFRGFFKDAIIKDFASMLCDFTLNEDAKDFEEYQDDVDLMGNSLRVFLKRLVAMALRDGSAFCLVDMPKADKDAKTLADVRDSEARPYFVLYQRDQVVNWRWVNTESGPMLSMVVLREELTKPDGDFGLKQYERYRVIHADGKYQVYEKELASAGEKINPNQNDADEVMEKIDDGTFDGRGIPLVRVSLTSHDPFTAEFPLIEMADLTLDYYRVRSGYRVTLDYMEPTLFAKEQQDFAMQEDSTQKHVKVGANATIWNLEDVRWIEPSGGGIQPKERCLMMLEQQIEKMTVAFFTGGAIAKTATEVEIDAAQSESTLSGYAYQLESAVQQMFRHFAIYQGKDGEKAGSITVNKSLLKPPAAWTPKDILEWVSTGMMSRELGYKILNELDLLPEGITFEEIESELGEIKKKEEEAQAMAAEMEQRKMEMQQQKVDADIQRQQVKTQVEAAKAQGNK